MLVEASASARTRMMTITMTAHDNDRHIDTTTDVCAVSG